MRIKDSAITGISLFLLVGSIFVAVRPQSNLVQIDNKPARSNRKFKVLRIKEKPTPTTVNVEKQRKSFAMEVDGAKIAKE